jgi:hypothetical protein
VSCFEDTRFTLTRFRDFSENLVRGTVRHLGGIGRLVQRPRIQRITTTGPPARDLSSLASIELTALAFESLTDMSSNTIAAPFTEPASYTRALSPYYKESHRYLREYVARYVEDELTPYAPGWESKGQVPPDVRPACNYTLKAHDYRLDIDHEIDSQTTC